ncbi:MAG: class I SAM-dependent methyltransferase [bacterium]|nr:class I SAM-dependent methyltransferase [bacterium]
MNVLKSHQVIEITAYGEEPQLVSNQLKGYFQGADLVRILEAGCGREWSLDLSGMEYHLTGLDLDKDALEARLAYQNDLDEAIVGDLRTIQLPEESYDAVYNSFVLEHIEGAEAVLDTQFNCLKPSGVLVLRIPDRYSVFTFLKRLTPHKLHVLYCRYIERIPHAGKLGHAPYPTFHERIVSRKGIYDYCDKYGHEILVECVSSLYLKSFGPLAILVKTLFKTIEKISFGRLTSDYDDLTFIIKKASISG